MFNMQNDKKLTITGVYIEGFCLPKDRLNSMSNSKSRAEALKYLSVHEQIPATTMSPLAVKIGRTGKALEASNMKEKPNSSISSETPAI